jgi:hypothetical protein
VVLRDREHARVIDEARKSDRGNERRLGAQRHRHGSPLRTMILPISVGSVRFGPCQGVHMRISAAFLAVSLLSLLSLSACVEATNPFDPQTPAELQATAAVAGTVRLADTTAAIASALDEEVAQVRVVLTAEDEAVFRACCFASPDWLARALLKTAASGHALPPLDSSARSSASTSASASAEKAARCCSGDAAAPPPAAGGGSLASRAASSRTSSSLSSSK